MTFSLEQPNLPHNSHNYSYTSFLSSALGNKNSQAKQQEKHTKDFQKSSRLRDTEVDRKSIQSFKGDFLQLLV